MKTICDSEVRRPWRQGGLPPGPVVKICGLTRLEDVLLAADLGAWALGFVFAPSPRRLTPPAARDLVEALGRRAPGEQGAAATGLPLTVGVFAGVPAEEIARVVEEVGLDGVQLHDPAGPGGDAVRMALVGWDRSLMVIQAVPVSRDAAHPDLVEAATSLQSEQADLVLLDTKTQDRFGGTGTTFPWHLARQSGQMSRLLIAGGIGPDNVEAALRDSGAWGVDVSSGVEQSPGVKDAQLMQRLFARVGGRRDASDDQDEEQGGQDQ